MNTCKAAFILCQERCGPDKIIETGFDFMTSNLLFARKAQTAATGLPVRGITDDHVEAFRFEALHGHCNIDLCDYDTIFVAVEANVSRRAIRHLPLNLNPCKQD